MKAEILTPDELTREEVDVFWEQGVTMDDWDYLVLAPAETVIVEKVERNEWNWQTGREELREVAEVSQTKYVLDRLLTGSCLNEWYLATFRGKEYAVGVAYHA